MCRKLIYLVSFLLVFVAADVRADLAGHWTLDEGSGTTVADSSGNGNDGTIVNNPTWIPGVEGTALEFHGLGAPGGGGDYIDCGNDASLDITGPISIALWIRPGADDPEGQGTETAPMAKAESGMSPSWSWQVRYGWGSSEPFMGFQFNTTPRTWVYVGENLERHEWCHIACSHDGATLKCYLNGLETDSAPMGQITSSSTPVLIGSDGWGCDWIGAIDDVRIYDHALSAGAVAEICPPPRTAANPDPPDEATAVVIPLLKWEAGYKAAFHDVYFGTTPDLGPDDFQTRNNKIMTMYYHGPGLTAGTTYYWRIDEVEADSVTTHTGDVWSFSTLPATAWNPSPADGAQFQDVDVDPSWSAGMNGTTHDVYFGTDEAAVAAGEPSVFQDNVTAESFDPGTLALETTYYWRIDEVESDNVTKHEGDVWSFTTLPDIPITDPSLIGWWKLDEGGATAVDWSGHAHHGTLQGDPQWVQGYDGDALDFDGSGDWVTTDIMPADFALEGSNAKTVTAWVYTRGFNNGGIYDMGSQSNGQEFCLRTKTAADEWRIQCWGFDAGFDHDFTYPTQDRWVHFAHVYDGTSTTLYANGEPAASYTKTLDTANAAFVIGRYGGSTGFDGIIDDLRLFNKALTQAEVKETMRGDPALAWNPKPANGSTIDVEEATPLRWSPGDNAAQHDVYLGTGKDAVEDADASDTTGVYRNRQGFTSYTPPEALQWGQTYYWRIDEYNADTSISTGRLWSFTVTDYLIVDDFEDYNDYTPDRIWQTWRDGVGYSEPPPGYAGNGTGSQVGNDDSPFTEQGTVHSGRQAMTFRYTNNGSTGKAMYSEAAREWAVPQDWTRKGVKALTLWFNGDAANSADPLYVGVQDSLGTRKDVPHDSAYAVLIGDWEEFNIDLQDFANAGVNLISVKKLILGVGNRLAPQMGGTGTLYFDDIRLYRPRCVPDKAKPAASFNDDCIVDDLDLQLMTDDWLMQDVPEPAWNGTFTSQDVGTPTAAGSYSFNGSSYTIRADGADIWGNADAFHYAYQQISGDTQMTVRVTSVDPVHEWAKAGIMIRDTLDAGSANAMVAITGGAGDGGTFQWRTDADGSSSSSRTLTGISPPACIKLVREGDTFIGYIFLDGKWQQEGTSATVAMTDPVYIGLAVTSHTDGTLTTATFDRACTFSAAELQEDGVIDFKDYAVLADAWLDELLWP
jgi:hypothetical protein